MSSDVPSPFHKKHICLTGYIGEQQQKKSTLSGVPIHASLLFTLIEIFFFNYKPSADRGEPGTWVTGKTGKSKQIGKKLVRGHSGGVATTGIPKSPL
jgi:hypothetical protein